MGVITYFLLAGYTPFDRDSQQLEMEAIIAGDYKFEPGASLSLLSPSPHPLTPPHLPYTPLTHLATHRRILVQRLRNRQRLCAHVSHDRPRRAADGGGGAAAPVARVGRAAWRAGRGGPDAELVAADTEGV